MTNQKHKKNMIAMDKYTYTASLFFRKGMFSMFSRPLLKNSYKQHLLNCRSGAKKLLKEVIYVG